MLLLLLNLGGLAEKSDSAAVSCFAKDILGPKHRARKHAEDQIHAHFHRNLVRAAMLDDLLQDAVQRLAALHGNRLMSDFFLGLGRLFRLDEQVVVAHPSIAFSRKARRASLKASGA